MEEDRELTTEEMLELWDNSIADFARDVEASRKTVYAWIAAGKVPKSRRDSLYYRIIPKRRARIKKQAELDAALEKEFGRGLFK